MLIRLMKPLTAKVWPDVLKGFELEIRYCESK